jgi:YD repeat-containing protein
MQPSVPHRKWLPFCLPFIIAIATFVQSSGQTLKVVPPAPNAAKMTEYHATQPNMYTGTASVSVPLYSIEFDGWQLPVSLSYNATGIRTTEEASEVGLGWSLNANGVISRIVRGGDDLWRGTPAGQGIGWVHNNEEFSLEMGYSQFSQRFADPQSYYYYVKMAVPDIEPDIFNYNFFGFSGSFVLSQKIVNGTIAVKKLTEDACIITFSETGETFTVITPTGYKGEFTVKERSTTMAGLRTTSFESLACGEDYFDHLSLVNLSGRYRSVTSWHLSKITSPRGRQINFNYFDIDINGNSPYISNQRTFAEDETIAQPLQCLQTIHEHVYLKEIVSTDIGLRLDFTMQDRADLRRNQMFLPGGPGGVLWQDGLPLKRYTGLTVTGLHPESGLSKSITFTQNYFNQHYYKNNQMEEENEVRWLRSRLDAVKIDDQEYTFQYYEGDKGVPNKMTHGVDYFGFYNGHDEIEHLIRPYIPGYGSLGNCDMTVPVSLSYTQTYNRTPDIEYGEAGLLKQVRYPTRGYSQFEYESHTYDPDQTAPVHEAAGVTRGGGARVKAVKDFDYDGTLQKHKYYKYIWEMDPTGTSGKLMTPLMNLGKTPRYIKDDPGYGDPEDINTCDYILESNSSIPGNNAAEGKIIGYSQVHEFVEGDNSTYKNVYYFENRENMPMEVPIASEGFPNLNGQIKEVRKYGDDNKIVQVTTNLDYDHNLETLHGLAYRINIPGADHLYSYQYYDIRRTFHKPFQIVTRTAPTPSQVVRSGDVITSWGPIMQTDQFLTYTNYQLSAEQVTNGNGDVVKTEYKRPLDYPAPNGPLWYMRLNSVNMVAPVIEQITTKNGIVVAAKANQYSLLSSPEVISTYAFNRALGSFVGSVDGINFPSPYEKRTTINSFEPITMKPREFVGSDGVVNSFIWDYNGDLPIVQGVGATYSNLYTAYAATVGTGNPDMNLRNHLSVAGAFITTFKHKPFVGVSKVVDPNGLKKTYEYDQYDRLVKVRDADNNILEQYEYKLKQPDPARLLAIEGSLDFGTLVPDFFTVPALPYIKCSDEPLLKARVIKVKNIGESPIEIYSMSVLPQAARFLLSGGTSGTIAPGTSVDVIVTFDDANQTIPFGPYTSTFTVTSNATNTVSPVAASATYVARICNLTVSPSPTKNFGATMGNIVNQPIVVTNNGNATHRMTAVPLNWNGTHPSNGYGSFTDPDFTVLLDETCMAPGQSVTLYANFIPTGNGTVSAPLSIISDYCPALQDVVMMLGEKIPSNGSTSTITPAPVTMAPYVNPSSTSTTVTLTNRSMYPATFTGVNLNNSMFSILPNTGFTLSGFEQKTFTLTYTAGLNFNPQTTSLVFQGQFAPETAGTTASAQRTSVRTIQLSANQLVFDPPLFTAKDVTVTNTGNNNLTINSVNNPNTQDWDATINSLPVTLAPGSSTNLAVLQKTPNAVTTNITVVSNKDTGNDVVQLSINTRVINVTPVTFPSFTATSVSVNTSVSNSGNTPLIITSASCTNGMFSASPSSFTVAPGGAQTVAITFTPTAYNFSLQSGTFTFLGNPTSGNNAISVSAQRTSLRTIQVSPASLVFNPPLFTYQNVTVTNVGNDHLSITGVSNPNTLDWTATLTPVSLSINQTATLQILQKTTNPANTTITVQSDANGGSGAVAVAADKKIIYVNPSSYTFPGFTGTSTSKNDFVVGNSGNVTMSVTSVTSPNGRFTVSPTVFSVAPGGQQLVSVTYNPTDFTSQSSAITFNGVFTSGSNTLNVTAQRTQVYQVSVSPNSVTIKPSMQVGASYVTNSGNVDVTVNSVGNSNTTNFAVTYYKYQSFAWVQLSGPHTLTPGQQVLIEVRTAQSGNYSGATGTATIFMSQGTNPTLGLVRATF